MPKSRIEERERLIRRLRNDPRLDDGSPKGAQITRLIAKAKDLCAPAWMERHDRRMTERLDRWMAIQ